MEMVIRLAGQKDISIILYFIKQLAEYEKMSDQVVATKEMLKEWMFKRKVAECLLAFEKGKPIGFALFFHNFSTFLGKAGIYLEDLYVEPGFRGKGVGGALLTRLASITIERGCGRLEWSCLNWNEPSIKFYIGLGAQPMNQWTTYRLTGDALTSLVKKE